jgi:hypothetical protein
MGVRGISPQSVSEARPTASSGYNRATQWFQQGFAGTDAGHIGSIARNLRIGSMITIIHLRHLLEQAVYLPAKVVDFGTKLILASSSHAFVIPNVYARGTYHIRTTDQ